jgi:hypothetical protein
LEVEWVLSGSPEDLLISDGFRYFSRSWSENAGTASAPERGGNTGRRMRRMRR